MSSLFEVLQSDETILLIAFKGKLDGNNLANQDVRFHALLNHQDTPVILDFSEVSFISSLGIRMLIIAYKDMKRQGQTLSVVKTIPEVEEVLRMVGLEELLD
jgi:anti-anti-sigma factor